MNRSVAVGVGMLAGLAGLGLLLQPRRGGAGHRISDRMLHHMERMMARLPDESPPKLVMSVLPRLRDQNEQIIGMLREQNALLRRHLQEPQERAGS